MSEVFVNKVKKYFGYLESEYGFYITKSNNSPRSEETDGAVEYSSNVITIVIDSEMGYAAVWFYRPSDGRKFDLDPVAIDEYLNTDHREKELLLSINPNDHLAAQKLFNEKFLLNQPEWRPVNNYVQDRLSLRLSNYSSWLRAHADLCLTGGFSRWLEFYEYKIYRARADHLRNGKDELGYVRVQDSEGKWVLVKQSIFKSKLDYVEEMKKEST